METTPNMKQDTARHCNPTHFQEAEAATGQNEADAIKAASSLIYRGDTH